MMLCLLLGFRYAWMHGCNEAGMQGCIYVWMYLMTGYTVRQLQRKRQANERNENRRPMDAWMQGRMLICERHERKAYNIRFM